MSFVWMERIKGIIDDLIKPEIVSAYPASGCFSTLFELPFICHAREFKLYHADYKNPLMRGGYHNQTCIDD